MGRPRKATAAESIKKIEKDLANYAAIDAPKLRKFLMAVTMGEIKDTVYVKARTDRNGAIVAEATTVEVDVMVKDRVTSAKVYGTMLLPKAVADVKQTEKNDSPVNHADAAAEVHEKVKAEAEKKVAASGGGGDHNIVDFPKAAQAKAAAKKANAALGSMGLE